MPKVVTPLTLSIALAFACFMPSAAEADTLTLKSGESYEGTILRDTDSEVVMLVQVSGGITDEQTFKKEDVETIETTPRDVVEYEKLVGYGYAAGQHSKTPTAYNLAIAAYEDFAKRFPESEKAAEAKSQVTKLKEERARVARKEVKINHRWYTQKEIKEEHYQISAQRLLQLMTEQANKGDLVGALNTFDKLESEFPGSAAYPQGIPLALSMIQRLRAEIVRAVPIAKEQQRKFDEGIDHTPEPDRSRMKAAHESNTTRAKAAFSQSTAKWKPFFAAMDESVKSLNTVIESEYVRLGAVDTSSMVKSVELTDQGREALTAKNYEAANAKFNEALTSWAANEAATRLKSTAENQAKAEQELEAARQEEEANKEKEAKAEKETPAKSEGTPKQG